MREEGLVRLPQERHGSASIPVETLGAGGEPRGNAHWADNYITIFINQAESSSLWLLL